MTNATDTDVDGGRPRITVLHSMGKPDGKTRYIDHMIDSAPAEVTVRPFSWSEALFGDYDVFHVHWPENLVRSRRRAVVVPKRVLYLILMARLRLSRRAVVRTVHNLAPHESGGSVEEKLIQLCDGLTGGYIRLNRTTPTPDGASSTTILHGHYRGRPGFECDPETRPEGNRLLYFGIIRPYKGVDDLVDAFVGLEGADASLRIVGHPQDEALAMSIREADVAHPSISCRLESVPDADLAEEISRARLVVLPYREMHNSGSAILALSMDRPVVAPSTPVNRELAEEVGPGWLYLYDSPTLDSDTLSSVLEQVAADDAHRPARPNLSGRDWNVVGEGHYAFYLSLLTAETGAESPVS